MSQQQDTGLFGDDINSTPISKLQQIPMMTSKSDPGMVPVEPPVYNPTVDLPQQPKRVTFADESDSDDSKRKSKKREKRHRHRHEPQIVPQYYMMPPPPPAAAMPSEPTSKKKRVFEVLQQYGHRLIIFVLVMAVLWYYRKLATFPYVGNGVGYVSTLGSAGIALAVSGTYGIIESLLD
jgi:hypothetical protein